MAVNNATGYKRTTNEPLDALYLDSGSTYSSTASVNSAVNIGVRHTGSMFNVNGELYWYKDGVQDSNLVLFNGPLSSSLYNLSSSVKVSSASFDNRLDYIEDRYATTGSNLFRGDQHVVGNIDVSGSLVFEEKVQASLTPGKMYMYVSDSGANVSDFYWTKYSGSYERTTRLGWMEGNLYTGLLHGGAITAVTGSTTYTVEAGHGLIVNLNASLTLDLDTSVNRVAWNAITMSIAPLSASYDQSYIAIDATGSVHVQGTPYNDGQYNTLIPLGAVLHQNRSTINGSVTFPSLAYGWKQRSSDFIRAFGPLKLSGFEVYTSSSLGLTIGSGTAFADGRNYTVDPNNPSYVVDAGTNTSKIYRYRQSGSGWVYDTNAGVGYSTIDPANYSNSGSLTPVPGTGSNREWTIQRVFFFPSSATKAIYVYYGNKTYLTAADAIASLNYEPFIEAPNTASQAVYLGALIVRNDAVFTDSTTYRILPAGLFRSVGGSGGGGSVITQLLSGLSDVNISGPTDGQPLIYRSTSNKWENTSAISASLHGTADNAISSSYAATSSYADNFSVGGNMTVAGTITAQKLVVQTITSSVVYASGSNVFGNSLANTQVLSGSVYIVGDGYMNGSQLMTSASVASGYQPLLTNPVTGITSSLDNSIAIFDGTTGKKVKDTKLIVTDYADIDAEVTYISSTVSSYGNGREITIEGADGTTGVGGPVFLVAGLPANGDGSNAGVYATRGIGTNKNGGSLYFDFGAGTGTGTNGGVVLSLNSGTGFRRGIFKIDNLTPSPAADKVWQMPNASGTVALTSDITTALGGYLPLSGGTLTGTLTLTSPAFIYKGTSAKTSLLMNSAGTYYGGIQNTSADRWALMYSNTATEALGTEVLAWTPTSVVISQALSGTSANFSSSVKSTRYLIAPDGLNALYNIVDATDTYTGSYILQAGGGSTGYGGGLVMYGHSHATKPGWVTAGISAGSGGKFSVNTYGNGAGTNIFTVDASGNVVGNGAATFGGNVIANNGGESITLFSLATNYATIRDKNSFDRIWFENTGGYRTIFDVPSGGSFSFRDNVGTVALTISNTGALVATSSITAGGDIRTDGGTLKIGAGSGSYYSQIATAYNYPYMDSYFDAVAGASYEGRLNFRTSNNGGALAIKMKLSNSGNLEVTGNVYAREFSARNNVAIYNDSYPSTYPTQIGSATGAVGYIQLGNNSDNYIVGGSTAIGGNLRFYVNNTSTLPTAPNGTLALTLNSAGGALFGSLVGSGNRIVYANSSGALGSMVIGSGLSFDGTTLSATGGSAGTVTGSGTAGYIPIWNSSSDIGNSVISQSGGNISISGVTSFTRSSLSFQINPSYAGGNVYSQLQSTGALALATNGDNNRLYITTAGNEYRNGWNNVASPSTDYKHSEFGGINIMYRNAGDAYINSNHQYNSSNANVASYSYANGIGRLCFVGGYLQWYAYEGSVTAGSSYTLTNKFEVTPAGAVTVASSVSASSFYGAGTGLTGTASGLSIGGNAATATNSTQWAGLTANFTTAQTATVANAIAVDVNGVAYKYTSGAFQTWLGLGLYAYRSSGLAELSGATFGGNVTVSLSSGNNVTLDKPGGAAMNFTRSSINKALIQEDSQALGLYYWNGSVWVRTMYTGVGGTVIDNALSGTTASFSGEVVGTRFGGTSSATSYFNGALEHLNGTLSYWYNTGSTVYHSIQNTAGVLEFKYNGGPAYLSLASTGAATFSSSVTATSYVQGGYLVATGSTGLVVLTSADWGASSEIRNSTTINGVSGGDYLSFKNPTGKGFSFVVNGSSVANLSSSGYFTAVAGGNSSDLTLKNIIQYNPQLNIADSMSVIKYTWKDLSKGIIPRFGYGAQDLLPLIPEAVYKTGDGTYAVDYTQVHTVLIDENTRRIQALEQELSKLKDQVRLLGGNI